MATCINTGANIDPKFAYSLFNHNNYHYENKNENESKIDNFENVNEPKNTNYENDKGADYPFTKIFFVLHLAKDKKKKRFMDFKMKKAGLVAESNIDINISDQIDVVDKQVGDDQNGNGRKRQQQQHQRHQRQFPQYWEGVDVQKDVNLQKIYFDEIYPNIPNKPGYKLGGYGCLSSYKK